MRHSIVFHFNYTYDKEHNVSSQMYTIIWAIELVYLLIQKNSYVAHSLSEMIFHIQNTALDVPE